MPQNKVTYLMKATGLSFKKCSEALLSADSVEDALEFLQERFSYRSNLRRGMIVVIDDPLYLPHSTKGTVSKVLKVVKSTNIPESWEVGGKTRTIKLQNIVILENTAKISIGLQYLNKDCMFEGIHCVKPASTEEKKRYKRN